MSSIYQELYWGIFYSIDLKGTVPLFWPRGPEFIVKLRNPEMGPSYGRKGKNFQLLFKWPGFFLKWPGFFFKWPGFLLLKMTRFLVKMTQFHFKMTRFLFHMTLNFLKWLLVTLHIEKWPLLLFYMTRFFFKMTIYFLKWPGFF